MRRSCWCVLINGVSELTCSKIGKKLGIEQEQEELTCSKIGKKPGIEQCRKAQTCSKIVQKPGIEQDQEGLGLL